MGTTPKLFKMNVIAKLFLMSPCSVCAVFAFDADAIMKQIDNAEFKIASGNGEFSSQLNEGIEAIHREFGDKAEGFLIGYVGDFSKGSELKIGAIVSLRYFGTMKSKDILIEALGRLPSGMMEAASKALSRLDGAGFAEELATREKAEIDEDVKNGLIRAMCNMSGPGQYKTILSWANSHDGETRRRGVSSLKNYNTNEGKQAIRRALFDDNEAVFYNAMMSLGYIGDKTDVALYQYLALRVTGNLNGMDGLYVLSTIKEAVGRIKKRIDIKDESAKDTGEVIHNAQSNKTNSDKQSVDKEKVNSDIP